MNSSSAEVLDTNESADCSVQTTETPQHISNEELAALSEMVPDGMQKAWAHNTPDEQGEGYKAYLHEQGLVWKWNGEKGEAVGMKLHHRQCDSRKQLMQISNICSTASKRLEEVISKDRKSLEELGTDAYCRLESILMQSAIKNDPEFVTMTVYRSFQNLLNAEITKLEKRVDGRGKKAKRVRRGPAPVRYKEDDEDKFGIRS